MTTWSVWQQNHKGRIFIMNSKILLQASSMPALLLDGVMRKKEWQIQRAQNIQDSLLIRGGRVIDPANGIDKIADVLIIDGKISEVGENIKTPANHEYDAAGKIVTPGLIDMHVHFREPGQEAKEDFESGFESWRDGFEGNADVWYQVQTEDFEEWFETIRNQLDTDQAGHLQNEIDAINETIEGSPWKRPVGTLTDFDGREIVDADGNKISITTLSQAELAAGVINAKAHY